MGYWDTSCLLKLYVAESDSAMFRTYAATTTPLVVSSFGRLELWAALRRKESLGELMIGGARRAFDMFLLDIRAGRIRIDLWEERGAAKFEELIERCYACGVALRTLDAIHLAAAVLSKEIELVTMDNRLRDAAIIERFGTFPP